MLIVSNVPPSVLPAIANACGTPSIWSTAAYSQDLSTTVGSVLEWPFSNVLNGDSALAIGNLSEPANTQESALNALLAFDPAFPNPFLAYESPSDPILSNSSVSDAAGPSANRPSRRTKLRIPYFRWVPPLRLSADLQILVS